MKNHVFVSHGSEDRVQANELAAFIEAKGVKSWIAPRDVRPGQDYSEQLQEAIETCSSFVVLVTDKANRSPYVRAETEMAFSTSKPIFPVRTSDIKPAAGLAFFLKIRHWTDAFGDDREANLARLARELQTFAGVAVDPTQFVADAEARGRAATAEPLAPTSAPPAPPPPPPPPPPAYVAPQPAQPAWQSAATLMAPTQPTQQISDISVPADPELLRAAIGPNADLYLQRWAAMDAKGSAISWNWPACLANVFWFAYRKMWLPMAGVFVAMLILSLISGSNPAFAQIAWLFSIGITFVTGGFGNYLYRQHVEKLIVDTTPLGRPAQLEALSLKGGVSKGAVFSVIGLIVAATVILGASTFGEIQRKGVTPGNDSRTAPPANGIQPVDQNGTALQPPLVPGGEGPLPPGGEQSGEKPPASPDDPGFQQDEGQQEVLEEQPQQ